MAKQGLRGIEAALTIPKDKKPSTKPKKEKFIPYDPWRDDKGEVFTNGKYLWEEVYQEGYEAVGKLYDNNHHIDNCDETYYAVYKNSKGKYGEDNYEPREKVAEWFLGRVGDKPAVKAMIGKDKGKIIYLDMSSYEEYYKEHPEYLE